VAFFERLRQIEEDVQHIVVLAGSISFLLASESYPGILQQVLVESIPDRDDGEARARAVVAELMPILVRRRESYLRRRPGILNLISGAEIDRLLRNGLVGRPDLSEAVRRARRARARAEAEHLCRLMDRQPIGVQIGIVPGTLPHNSFQIFRQPDREILALSPYRLGEQPNVLGGVAMITSAPEALDLHQRAVEDLWGRALKGAAGADYLRRLIVDAGDKQT
jgi:hypothetical protein